MLSAKWLAEKGIPVVFLHGLLGSSDDWAETLSHLQHFSTIRPLVIDLPFHAASQHILCRDFDEARGLIHSTISHFIGNQPFWLVGYSLGGRLALDYALHTSPLHLQGTILEGANIGLQSEEERQARWQNDLAWAKRFQTEPIKNVLEQWYQQPVFAYLSTEQRQALIEKRSQHHGENIAAMLKATSLAQQTDFRGSDWRNITFFIGEQDLKFRQMVEENYLPYRLIAKAGHNAHWENPSEFATQLISLITHTHRRK